MAKDMGISFEKVSLNIGSSPSVVHLSIGAMKTDPDFIKKTLSHLQTIVPANSPVIMTFQKAHVPTGFDLLRFCQELGIEIGQNEVTQE